MYLRVHTVTAEGEEAVPATGLRCQEFLVEPCKKDEQALLRGGRPSQTEEMIGTEVKEAL